MSYPENRKDIPFTLLTPIDKETYYSNINEINSDLQKHQFDVGDKVSWVDRGVQYTGIVVNFSKDGHKAHVSFVNDNGTDQVEKVSILKLLKSEK